MSAAVDRPPDCLEMETDNKLRIALIQFRRNRFDPPDNQRRMDELLPGIGGADVVMMPEAWRGPQAVPMKDVEAMLSRWGEVAAKQQFTLLTGGLFIDTGPAGIIDICHVIGPDGKLLGGTEKIFPSEPVGERKYLAGGSKLPVFEVAGLKFGILICIDLIYPELARSLVLRGADIIFNPANIPLNRMSMWHRLIQTRAAENTVFTVFSTNTGTTYPDYRDVLGHSAAAAPYGELCFEAGQSDGVYHFTLDLNAIPRIRKKWPYLDDVRSIAECTGENVVIKDNN
jgi:predicted amidohydrolase